MYGDRDRQTDRQAGRQADRQTDRQTGTQRTYIHIHILTYRVHIDASCCFYACVCLYMYAHMIGWNDWNGGSKGSSESMHDRVNEHGYSKRTSEPTNLHFIV